jgi:hypothetical protein
MVAVEPARRAGPDERRLLEADDVGVGPSDSGGDGVEAGRE